MTQAQLNREVAAATGESVRTIARRGFELLLPEVDEPDREPLVVDWDALAAHQQVGPVVDGS